MPPRRFSSSPTSFAAKPLVERNRSSSEDRVIVTTTMQEQASTTTSPERMILPQHMQDLVACASKITIISDNAKVPPLSPWSPLFRERRGLPPLLQRGGDLNSSSSDGGRRRPPESRWESMPQPKRINDDTIPGLNSLARIRQCGYLMGQEIGYGIPLPSSAEDTSVQSSPAMDTYNNESENTNSHNSNNSNNNNNEEKTEHGLNLPRRRASLEVGKDSFSTKDGVSLLSQVLSALDLSENEEDEDYEGRRNGFILSPLRPPPPPPLRYTSPPPPMSRHLMQRDATRPALSPEQNAPKGGADKLSIPVRRESIDSVDYLLSKEDLEGLCSDEDDDTEHADMDDFDDDDDDDSYNNDDDDEDDDDEDDDDEDDDETEFCDETENGEDSRSSDIDDSEGSFHSSYKDDSTLVTAASATTSTTLSTLRSTDSRDRPER